MNSEAIQLLWPFGFFIGILFIIGLYCILVTQNLIRALIGLEILIKAVTLLLILSGYITGHTALSQAVVITLIVVEVVIITVAVGVVLGIHTHNRSLDATKIRNLKG
jgi:multisubunit Na+/H+ antiporter MnhC subunit